MRNLNICIIQPLGFFASLGFLDQARYLRYQFRRMGINVSIMKNRLKNNSINIIIGAHLEFDVELKKKYACVFLNLEQLGSAGCNVSDDYMSLLENSAVLDYDEKNLKFYQNSSVELIGFAYAPYLEKKTIDLKSRPIDLLFFGSVNERRKRIFERILNLGINIKFLEYPVFGEERDELISQSKAVLNCHYYDAACFEQARVFHCLSLGTPVISERVHSTNPSQHFLDSVFWIDNDGWECFFENQFLKPDFYEESVTKIEKFKKTEVGFLYRKSYEFMERYHDNFFKESEGVLFYPDKINVGSGKNYKLGWLNIDISEKTFPDVLINLGDEQNFPKKIKSDTLGMVEFRESQVSYILADNVLEHFGNLPLFMENCLKLLKEEGVFEIIVPYEKSNTAWQDPTHVRAMNEDSWIYYSEWFWYLGWFEYKFDIVNLLYLDKNMNKCIKPRACFMHVVLVKKKTTHQEKLIARTMQADFGGFPDDK